MNASAESELLLSRPGRKSDFHSSLACITAVASYLVTPLLSGLYPSPGWAFTKACGYLPLPYLKAWQVSLVNRVVLRTQGSTCALHEETGSAQLALAVTVLVLTSDLQTSMTINPYWLCSHFWYCLPDNILSILLHPSSLHRFCIAFRSGVIIVSSFQSVNKQLF